MPVSRRRQSRAAARAARSRNAITTTRRRGTNKFYLAASVVIAVLVIASFAFSSIGGGGGNADTGSGDGYVEGVGIQVDIESREHVPEGTTVTYNNTVPPTSGDHWPTPARCGFYEEGLPDERIVHNLEHGNIVVSYNLATEAEVDSLKDVMGDIGLANIWGITRSYDALDVGQVALATWGILDAMTGVDAQRISTFFDTYSGIMGPELVTC